MTQSKGAHEVPRKETRKCMLQRLKRGDDPRHGKPNANHNQTSETIYPSIFVEEIPNILTELTEDFSDLAPTSVEYANKLKEVAKAESDLEPNHRFTITITADIVEPDIYDEAVGVMLSAIEGDEVSLLINSHGGQLDSLIYLTNAINQTCAVVTGVLMGSAASAAGALFLNCHHQVVGDMTTMMIHNASYGSLGKDRDVLSHVIFTNKQNRKFVERTYKHFLSTTEIEAVIDGDELYFDEDEIIARLKVRSALRDPVNLLEV